MASTSDSVWTPCPPDHQRHRRRRKAKESAADIAHEYLRGLPIVNKKTERGRQHRSAQQGRDGSSPQQADRDPSDRGPDGLHAGDAVYAVHEIIGVDEPYDDRKGHYHHQQLPARAAGKMGEIVHRDELKRPDPRQMDIVPVAHVPHQQSGCGGMHRQPPADRDRANVVEEAHAGDKHRTGQITPREEVRL